MVKKILIFSTAYFPFVGGAEVAVKEITDRISDMEFDMVTARMDSKLSEFERIGNINVYRIGIGLPIFDKLWLIFRGAAFAQRLYKKSKYDAIWSIMASFGGFAAGDFKKKNLEVKFLLNLQEGDDLAEVERKVRFIKGRFKNIFTSADYIQPISNYLADWGKKMGAACPIEVVPNGVNVEKFRISNFEFRISDLKTKLGIKEDEKIVITASRLVKKNAVDDVIKSLKYLPANIKFLILGDGVDRKKLEQLAKKLNISNRIIFFGAYNNDDLPQYLALADVFVRPSISEGQGISFLEAMAAGVPVIATPVGGIPDFLFNGETGWFCEVKNPESIAEKIKYILDQKNYASVKNVVNNAREMVEKKYDWDGIAVKMKEIFTNL